MSLTKKFLFYSAFVAFCFVTAEFLAYASLEIYKMTRSDIVQPSSYEKVVREEVSYIHRNARLSPFRAYAPLANYQGLHVKTDALGFRIDPEKLALGPKIGVYGGSTVFSLTTQDMTIPNLMKVKGFQTLNFGVGGYSSSNEIFAFFESFREYRDLSVAIFYHGVNELNMFREIDTNDRSQVLMGGIYKGQHFRAISNHTSPSLSILDSNLHYIASKVMQAEDSEILASEPDVVIRQIKEIYFENISIIQAVADAKRIKTFFFLQPSIYTTDVTTLKGPELNFYDSGFAKNLYPLLVFEIMRDIRSKKYQIYNLEKVLSEKEDVVFIDWHHLNGKGNRIVAKVISKIIHSQSNLENSP
tara:strand:- start:407 stop:1480 length:1074 start_codon:yes stop_codon:yes gene_type:complete